MKQPALRSTSAALGALVLATLAVGVSAGAPATAVLGIEPGHGGFLTGWELVRKDGTAGAVINGPGPEVSLPPEAGGRARLWVRALRPGATLRLSGWASGKLEVRVGGVRLLTGVGGKSLVPDWVSAEIEIPSAERVAVDIEVAGAKPRFVLRAAGEGLRYVLMRGDADTFAADGYRLGLAREMSFEHDGSLALVPTWEVRGARPEPGAPGASALRWQLDLWRGRKPVRMVEVAPGVFVARSAKGGTYRVTLRALGATGKVVRERSFRVDHHPELVSAIVAAERALDVRDGDPGGAAKGRSAREIHALAALVAAREVAARLELAAEATREAWAWAELARRRAAGPDGVLGDERGLVPRGIVSSHDGRVQVYAVYLPGSARPARGWPLILGFHGRGTTGMSFCKKVLGGADAAPGILVCPYGYGPSAFLFAGEADALGVLDAARGLGVDPDRIYVTGGSHGGVGAYGIALQHPHRFAAAAVLSGSADVSLFGSIAGKPKRPHEKAWLGMRAWSHWAANARHVGFKVVHGARDRLSKRHALVFGAAMKRAGLPVELTVHPDLGHDVWTRTYADGAIWKFFAAHTKPTGMVDVSLVTYGRPVRERWFGIARVADDLAPGKRASLRARIKKGAVRIATKGVAAVALLHPREVAALSVDGVATDPAPYLWQRGKRWEAGPEPGPWRAGPLDVVRARPLVFVVPDGDAALRELAAADRDRLLAGMKLRYAVKGVSEVTAEDKRTRTLLLYGAPAANRLLEEVLREGRVGVSADGVRVEGVVYRGKDVGLRALLPSPWSATEYVVVVAGPTVAGVRCAVWLPEVLPDYAVCTAAKLRRPGGMVLGKDRTLLAAGFWERSFWRSR